MAKRDFNLKTSLVYSKDILDGTYTEGRAVEAQPVDAPIQQAVKSPQNEPVSKAKVPTKAYQQTFRMSKSDYDFIKGLIVYQRMNGKPTFTRGDAIALWVEWIQEKCPTVKPYTEDL